MFKIKENKGFSLIEVLISATIFLVATVSLFAAFSKSRENTEQVDKRLRAAYVGRQVLEDLRAKVDSRNWDDTGGQLEVGNHGPITIDGYTVNYTVTEDADTGARKVTMTISWTP